MKSFIACVDTVDLYNDKYSVSSLHNFFYVFSNSFTGTAVIHGRNYEPRPPSWNFLWSPGYHFLWFSSYLSDLFLIPFVGLSSFHLLNHNVAIVSVLGSLPLVKDSQICSSSPCFYSGLRKWILTLHLTLLQWCPTATLSSTALNRCTSSSLTPSQQICSSSHAPSDCPTYTRLPESKPCSH